jgi:predicted metal-dependent peptidase
MLEKRIHKLLAILVSSTVPTVRYFGIACASMKLVFGERFGTLATDGVTLYVNPDYAGRKSDPELLFILGHEAFHREARHSLRLRDVLPQHRELMHQAADYAVNLALLLDPSWPYAMPEGGLLRRDFVDNDGRALNAETIFQLLLNEQQQQQQQQQQQEQQCSSQDIDDSEADDTDDADTGDSETGDSDADETEADSEGDADDNSESESGSSSQEIDGSDPNADDDVIEATGELLPAPDDYDETAADIETAKAEVIAETAGSLPDYLKEQIKSNMEGDRDWMTEFRYLFARAVDKSDYSLRRPNQRYASTGLIMPILRNECMNNIAIITDTSGSMSTEELSLAQAQTKSIVDEWNPVKTTLIQHDSVIQDIAELTTGERPDDIEYVGRGGTRFDPVCDWLNDNTPDVAIWITDCMPCDRTAEPDCPVIFLSTVRYGRRHWEGSIGYGEYIDLT